MEEPRARQQDDVRRIQARARRVVRGDRRPPLARSHAVAQVGGFLPRPRKGGAARLRLPWDRAREGLDQNVRGPSAERLPPERRRRSPARRASASAVPVAPPSAAPRDDPPASGSTALMMLLAQHPKVEALGEAPWEPLNVNDADAGTWRHRHHSRRLRNDAGGSLRRILSTCDAPACAVKVQSADVHAGDGIEPPRRRAVRLRPHRRARAQRPRRVRVVAARRDDGGVGGDAEAAGGAPRARRRRVRLGQRCWKDIELVKDAHPQARARREVVAGVVGALKRVVHRKVLPYLGHCLWPGFP